MTALWENVDTGASDPAADIRRAIAAIEDDPEPYRATVTVHHPRCPTVETGDLLDCLCGGALFPS